MLGYDYNDFDGDTKKRLRIISSKRRPWLGFFPEAKIRGGNKDAPM